MKDTVAYVVVLAAMLCALLSLLAMDRLELLGVAPASSQEVRQIPPNTVVGRRSNGDLAEDSVAKTRLYPEPSQPLRAKSEP